MRWLAAAALVAACGGGAKPGVTPATADCMRLRALEEKVLLVFDAKARKNFAAALARDVVFMVPWEEILVGDDARQWVASERDPRDPWIFAWTPAAAIVAQSGDLAVSYGASTWSQTLDGETEIQHGRFVNVWRKDAEGWKIAAHLRTDWQASQNGTLPAVRRGKATCLDPMDGSAARAAVMEADRTFDAMSADEGIAAAFAHHAADQALLLGPDAVGPAAIAAVFSDDQATLRWTPLHAGASAAGDLAWTAGEGVYETAAGQRLSKYITIWQRQRDGSWRWILDAGSPRPTQD